MKVSCLVSLGIIAVSTAFVCYIILNYTCDWGVDIGYYEFGQ